MNLSSIFFYQNLFLIQNFDYRSTKETGFLPSIVPSEIQWTSFFFFKLSLMISFWTEILHMHIIYLCLIYNCMFEHSRLENKSGISCKVELLIIPQCISYG